VQITVRIPAFANAGSVNSDAAVIGLQARHILQGEWSWFLWGANYQASFDALLTAGVFAVLGPRPEALMLMPLLGHVLMLFFAYRVLCRRLEPGLAFILVLGLSWMPVCIEWSYFPPRQWSMTVAMAGVWLLDGASESRRPWLNHAAAGLLGVLSLYLDFYTLQLAFAVCLFNALCAFDPGIPRGAALRRIGSFAAVAGAVLLPLLLAWQDFEPGGGKAGLSLSRVRFNARLLLETCLPRLLGAKIYVQRANLLPDLWDAPLAFHAVQVAGALLFLAGLVWGGLLAVRSDSPWSLRRLGALGFLVAASSVVGFLFSIMPSDLWSARYLAPVTVFAPFALAPVAWRLGRVRMALGLLPHLLATLVGSWLLLGPRIHGLVVPDGSHSAAGGEPELCDGLRRLGIHHAAAPYWIAYRLSFLCREDPVVVPLEAKLDRHPPSRREYLRAPLVALIFHPSDPRLTPEEAERALRSRRASWMRRTFAGYTLLIWDRNPDGDRLGR
jgi:hypothetical protein